MSRVHLKTQELARSEELHKIKNNDAVHDFSKKRSEDKNVENELKESLTYPSFTGSFKTRLKSEFPLLVCSKFSFNLIYR